MSTYNTKGLIVDRYGDARPILANAVAVLTQCNEWEGVLGFNEFTMSVAALKPPPWDGAVPLTEWTENEDRLATEWLQRRGLSLPISTAAHAVDVVARRNPFHPVRSYLESLKWDGLPRLEVLFKFYFGRTATTDYERAVGHMWLKSAVARVYLPGCKADHCLVLEGPQGVGKSSALAILGGDFYTDELGDLRTKDAPLNLRGTWIVELPELDVLNRVDASRIKAFISRSTDRFRPPYGRRAIQSPRQCVFAGTVNHSNYLIDETGGRRFWPVRCGPVLDLEGLRIERDRIWAEAVARFKSGEPWWPASESFGLAAEAEQCDRFIGDAWDEIIESLLFGHTGGPNEV